MERPLEIRAENQPVVEKEYAFFIDRGWRVV